MDGPERRGGLQAGHAGREGAGERAASEAPGQALPERRRAGDAAAAHPGTPPEAPPLLPGPEGRHPRRRSGPDEEAEPNWGRGLRCGVGLEPARASGGGSEQVRGCHVPVHVNRDLCAAASSLFTD